MTSPNLAHRLLSADFLTLVYRVVGRMMVPAVGMLAMLNDPASSFMEVVDAKLAPIHMPTKLVGEYEILDLVKSGLFAVCLARREDAGTQVPASSTHKAVKYPIRVATPVYQLEGTLEWSGRFDFEAVMHAGSAAFMPLYNATLTAILFPQLRIQSPAVLFNRRQVDLLAVITDDKQVLSIA